MSSSSELRALMAAAAIAACLGLSARAQPDDCQPLVDAFNAALARGDLPAIDAAARAVVDDIACRAPARDAVGRAAALAHLRAAERMPDTPADRANKLALLEGGMGFGHPWQLMAAIGDLRQQVRDAAGRIDYGGASLAYQAALADIADAQRVPVPPPRAEIQRLIRLAGQDRLAANAFTRGDILMTRDLRGVQVESVPVPIQFVFARDEMTDQGRQYAQDLVRILRGQSEPRIALVGHTDRVGGDRYNLDLSLRRAQAVRSFLLAQGYPADMIEAAGRGWHEPLRLQDEKQYSREIIDQMLRRVELRYR
jgi:outer membrane protein OmpA-like peptidoglycan-associated protein